MTAKKASDSRSRLAHRCAKRFIGWETAISLHNVFLLPNTARQASWYASALYGTGASNALTTAASIERILNLNNIPQESSDTHHDPSAANGLIPKSTPILNSDGEPIWKVLVFDNLGRDVISSVLRVNDLRGWGITIHLYVRLHEERKLALRTLDSER